MLMLRSSCDQFQVRANELRMGRSAAHLSLNRHGGSSTQNQRERAREKRESKRIKLLGPLSPMNYELNPHISLIPTLDPRLVCR